MLFLSSYTNKVDKKGRVSVPAQFRSVLEKEPFQGIVVYASFINEALEACSLSRMEKLSTSIDLLDPYSEERDAFAATILGGSSQLPFDTEGRVIIPQSLIEQFAIEDKVVFVGKGSSFEIWEHNKFNAYLLKAREIAKVSRDKLRLI